MAGLNQTLDDLDTAGLIHDGSYRTPSDAQVPMVINTPNGRGRFHLGGTSTNLLTWVFQRTLDAQASQPTILVLPTGSFLTAVEFNDLAGSVGLLRFRLYVNLAALLAGMVHRERTMPVAVGLQRGHPEYLLGVADPGH